MPATLNKMALPLWAFVTYRIPSNIFIYTDTRLCAYILTNKKGFNAIISVTYKFWKQVTPIEGVDT